VDRRTFTFPATTAARARESPWSTANGSLTTVDDTTDQGIARVLHGRDPWALQATLVRLLTQEARRTLQGTGKNHRASMVSPKPRIQSRWHPARGLPSRLALQRPGSVCSVVRMLGDGEEVINRRRVRRVRRGDG
jgi:hypothetical protein